MRFRAFRHAIVILVATAFLAVSFGQVVMASPQPHSSMKMSSTGDKSMPCCKDKTPPCMNEFGCVFMMSLPAQPVPAIVPLTWEAMDYWTVSRDFAGRMPAPNLEPPIRFI